MLRRAIQIVFLLLTFASCGETETDHALDPNVLTYVLREGSEIVLSPADGSAQRREALVGSFDVRCNIPRHASFMFEIVRLELQSQSFAILGNQGGLSNPLSDTDLRLSFVAFLTINGADVWVGGGGTRDSYTSDPVRFRGVRAIGGEYAITISADPIDDRTCCERRGPPQSDCAPLQPVLGADG